MTETDATVLLKADLLAAVGEAVGERDQQVVDVDSNDAEQLSDPIVANEGLRLRDALLHRAHVPVAIVELEPGQGLLQSRAPFTRSLGEAEDALDDPQHAAGLESREVLARLLHKRWLDIGAYGRPPHARSECDEQEQVRAGPRDGWRVGWQVPGGEIWIAMSE